jgi:dihydroflavonol-4-reductase
MLAMLVDAKGTVHINYDSWTNITAKNVSAYFKSKTLAEKSAWDFIEGQKGDA